jgi:ribosomal protein S18 acetylase RimI-like enzyme
MVWLMTAFAVATPEQRPGALSVWRAANEARGHPPSPIRIARVHEKLAEDSACLLIGCDTPSVIAMALAEPGREQDGAGAIRPSAGHISMVFVIPERWGVGIGGELLDALHGELRERNWRTASLWTRSSNERARRLYQGRGYRPTGDVKQLPSGEEILRYELQLGDCK